MTQLTFLGIPSSYGDLLTTTNNGNGLTTTLENLQDGLGNNSPVQIATNAINFNRTGGRTMQLDGIPLTVSATTLNNIQANESIASGTLSPVQVMAMNGASIEVIPAQGPNTLVLVNQFVLSLVYNSIQYANGGSPYLQYSANGAPSSSNSTATVSGDVSAIQNNSSSILVMSSDISSVAGSFANSVNIINIPICITNSTGAFTAGDSNINYYISYTLINL